MKIPFNYLPYQFKNTNIFFREWKKMIKSSKFTLGPYVDKFEKAFFFLFIFNDMNFMTVN